MVEPSARSLLMRLVIAVAALAACAPADVDELAGELAAAEADAVPARRSLVLTVEDFVEGGTTVLTAAGANPGDRVFFVAGPAGAGPCPPALGGLCLDVSPVRLIGSALADATGVAILSAVVPATVSAGDEITFQAVIAAGATSSVSLPVTEVADAHEVHTFAPAAVDFLFVVDDSCSMYDEQTDLVASFPYLLNRLGTSGFDWHAGVVTTDMDDPARSGRLVESAGLRYVDATTPYPDTVFAGMAAVGTTGSATERGLAAMTHSLDTWGATFNAGFHRADAQLAVIVMSDEEDFSTDTSSSYASWLAATKVSPDDARLHSLTDPGFSARYLDVSAASGGATHDIATYPWGAFFDAVADTLTTSAPMVLAVAPDPATIAVVANEATGDVTLDPATDFVYDAADNSVRTTSAYVSTAGTTFEVTYEPL